MLKDGKCCTLDTPPSEKMKIVKKGGTPGGYSTFEIFYARMKGAIRCKGLLLMFLIRKLR